MNSNTCKHTFEFPEHIQIYGKIEESPVAVCIFCLETWYIKHNKWHRIVVPIATETNDETMPPL